MDSRPPLVGISPIWPEDNTFPIAAQAEVRPQAGSATTGSSRKESKQGNEEMQFIAGMATACLARGSKNGGFFADESCTGDSTLLRKRLPPHLLAGRKNWVGKRKGPRQGPACAHTIHRV